jgi:hypothetical protein
MTASKIISTGRQAYKEDGGSRHQWLYLRDVLWLHVGRARGVDGLHSGRACYKVARFALSAFAEMISSDFIILRSFSVR